MALKYKLLGKEEGCAICDFCGRKEISILHHVQDMDTGETFVFGSSCIVKALKIGMDEFKQMQATKELEDLEIPFKMTYKVSRNTGLWKVCIEAEIVFENRRYCRLHGGSDLHKILTDSGYWTDCETRKAKNLWETRKPFQDYLRKLNRLEKILSTNA